MTTLRERSRLLKVGRKLGTPLRNLMSIASDEFFCGWVRLVEGSEKLDKEASAPTRKPGSASDRGGSPCFGFSPIQSREEHFLSMYGVDIASFTGHFDQSYRLALMRLSILRHRF
ncbi:MAG: hypothetical protein WBC44_02755 [Planctomycetaceae bacterium]